MLVISWLERAVKEYDSHNGKQSPGILNKTGWDKKPR